MAKEKYMVIDPDGSTRWIELERYEMLDKFHEALGTDSLENVRTAVRDVCLIVDEIGKLRIPPRIHNNVASWLYPGWIMGLDDIAGPAILAAIHLVDGDPDWVPLNDFEWIRVNRFFEQLGIPFCNEE